MKRATCRVILLGCLSGCLQSLSQAISQQGTTAEEGEYNVRYNDENYDKGKPAWGGREGS